MFQQGATPNWQVDAPEFVVLGQHVVQTNKGT